MASTSQPQSNSPVGLHGVVRGQIVRPPGRDPRSGNNADAAAPVPVSGDTVRVYDPEGRTVATAVSAVGGQFEFVLSPGAYRVTEDICGVSRQVEVRSREITSLILAIPRTC
ncbi:hypothetical protein ACWGCW_05755 [Streptomyces sp. NPDC054933]